MMSVDFQNLDDVLARIKLLPPEYRLRLMQGILESLIPSAASQATRILRFGEYKDFDGPMSTLEDYTIAEWRPSERELDGE
jgi:hypothetical protein